MVWASLVVLSGCAWLMDVPEDEIPVREEVGSGNRQANQVNAPEYHDPSTPRTNAELPMGSDGTPRPRSNSNATRAAATPPPEPTDGWNPVSRPVEPKESSKAFEFKTADGTVIQNGPKGTDPYPGYPTAAELKVSEERRRRMIREGEVTNDHR